MRPCFLRESKQMNEPYDYLERISMFSARMCVCVCVGGTDSKIAWLSP